LIVKEPFQSIGGIHFCTKEIFRPLSYTTTLEECQGPEDLFLIQVKLLWCQLYVEQVGVEEHPFIALYKGTTPNSTPNALVVVYQSDPATN